MGNNKERISSNASPEAATDKEFPRSEKYLEAVVSSVEGGSTSYPSVNFTDGSATFSPKNTPGVGFLKGDKICFSYDISRIGGIKDGTFPEFLRMTVIRDGEKILAGKAFIGQLHLSWTDFRERPVEEPEDK